MRVGRQNAIVAIAALGLLLALVIAPLAGGAPTAQGTPSISGYPGYNSVLTCKRGTWSADAESFSYGWAYEGDPDDFASGPTHRATAIGQRIVCRVTARDAAGDATVATSPSVLIGRGRTSIKVKAKKVQHKKVTLTGTIKPKAALGNSGAERKGSIVAYRVEKDGLHQLFGKQSLKANGKFKIVAPDEPGKNRYKVNFNPEPSQWEFASGFVTVRLKKR